MDKKARLQYIHRRPRRRARQGVTSDAEPEPTGSFDSTSDRRVTSLGSRAGSYRPLPPPAELPADWQRRRETCNQLGIAPDELFRRVARGDVAFTTDGYQVVYDARTNETVFAAPAGPGDTLELALSPPDLKSVGALVGFADELSERFGETIQAYKVALARREEAVNRLRSASEKLAGLQEQNVTLKARLRKSESAGELTQRSLQRWNDHAMDLQRKMSLMRARLSSLAQLPEAHKIRAALLSLLEELK